jgi:hypothetical protein
MWGVTRRFEHEFAKKMPMPIKIRDDSYPPSSPLSPLKVEIRTLNWGNLYNYAGEREDVSSVKNVVR